MLKQISVIVLGISFMSTMATAEDNGACYILSYDKMAIQCIDDLTLEECRAIPLMVKQVQITWLANKSCKPNYMPHLVD